MSSKYGTLERTAAHTSSSRCPNGIDLAVVTDHPERMRQLPRGKRVGREALVNEAQCAHRIRIGQFLIEFRDLRREQQALINDRS